MRAWMQRPRPSFLDGHEVTAAATTAATAGSAQTRKRLPERTAKCQSGGSGTSRGESGEAPGTPFLLHAAAGGEQDS